jgi:hypothetical protein
LLLMRISFDARRQDRARALALGLRVGEVGLEPACGQPGPVHGPIRPDESQETAAGYRHVDSSLSETRTGGFYY